MILYTVRVCYVFIFILSYFLFFILNIDFSIAFTFQEPLLHYYIIAAYHNLSCLPKKLFAN